MPTFSRRRFLQASVAGLAATSLSACTSQSVRRQDLPAAGEQLQLLFYADTHAHWLPVTAHPPANHLGPMDLLGQAPYMTESSRLDALGLSPETSAAAWLTARGARQQGLGLGKMGGYAALAAGLKARREAFGPQASLTLEGGQCWNGSGLAQVSSGRHGPLSSHWLGAEVRIASEEQQIWPDTYSELYQAYQRPVLSDEHPLSFFDKGGMRLAVIGVTYPDTRAEGWDENTWLAQIQSQVHQAGEEAQLVLLLSDAGTNPNFWLAQRLQGVDLILSSRGQDLWPDLVSPRLENANPIPVCLAGSQGQGFFEIRLTSAGDHWQLEADYHPLWSQLAPAASGVAEQIARLRAPFAGWLEEPLAVAPDWLYRRDALAGTWDQLIAEALKTQGAQMTLAPGLRHGLAVAPGETLTREHLLSLTAGYEAPVYSVQAGREEVRSRLEAGTAQWLGSSLFLHTSEDLPRLTGGQYLLRYQAPAGQRVAELQWPAPSTSDQVRISGWSQHYQQEGTPLWQLLESWLRERPANWQLPEKEEPSLAFVEGHPGWHPQALVSGEPS
ncbi:lipoprotein UxpA [Marinospirillum perlucidum]|uniref:lipoprotein UxpA n=1 Tax=Marinospirillum perlucidum TaxID=1982602 RepID=UPI000DF1A0BA|nr:lipoprotein UxpA [Marinospirillum perlucidum]